METLTLERKKQSRISHNQTDSDDYFTPAMIAKIELAMLQCKRGEGVVCKTYEESMKFFDAL